MTLTGVVSSLATTPVHTYTFRGKLYVDQSNSCSIYEYGEPDVFRFETMDVPDPVGHEVLVRNTVIGLNLVDIYYRRGTLSPAAIIRQPHTDGRILSNWYRDVPIYR